MAINWYQLPCLHVVINAYRWVSSCCRASRGCALARGAARLCKGRRSFKKSRSTILTNGASPSPLTCAHNYTQDRTSPTVLIFKTHSFFFVPSLPPSHLTHTHAPGERRSTMGSTAAPPPPPPPPSPPAAPPPAPAPAPTTAAPFRIRKARPSDAAAVASLGAAVFASTFEDSGCTPEQLRRFLSEAYTPEAIGRDMADPNKEYLVAVAPAPAPDPDTSGPQDGGAAAVVVGFVLMTRGSHADEPCVRHVEAPVELQRLYVGAGQQGRGVGRALAGEAMGTAAGEGFRHVWLGVWEGNHRARRIYGEMGFARVGEHAFDVGGDLQTDEIMLKVL